MSDKVSKIIDKYGADRSQLVSILQDIQAEYCYLPEDALLQVSETMGIPASRVYDVATFFKAFSLQPRGKHIINVCLGTACHVRGGHRVLETMERCLSVKRGDTTRDGKFTLESVNCMGCCAVGPAVKINGDYFGHMSTDKVDGVLAKFE
jgi:NADH-quinone oxidoreductase subunit E